MRKTLVIPLLALMACGGSQTFKDQARDAMPSKDAVAMSSPQAASSLYRGKGDSIEQDSTAGQHSPFFDLTVGVATTFNLGTVAILGILEAVTDTEPSKCDATSCTWGPGSSPLDYNIYKLVVTKGGDGFDYELSGQAKTKPNSDFIVFLSGHAVPGVQRHHGSGNFTADMDKANLLDGPHGGPGKMVVTSYSNVGPAHLDVNLLGIPDGTHPDQKLNIAYSYANDTTGGGDLDVAVHNITTADNFSVHSRWKNDGRGRSDVQGSGNGYQIQLSECWAAAPFQVVYFSSSLKLNAPPFGGPDSGAETQCAYSPAAYSTKTAP